MKGRIGTKHYDTEKSILIETKENGMQVYQKKGRSLEYYIYNPSGNTTKEKFLDISYEEIVKYIPVNKKSKAPDRTASRIRFTPYDLERIKTLAIKNKMPMNKFIIMLVDEYERKTKGG